MKSIKQIIIGLFCLVPQLRVNAQQIPIVDHSYNQAFIYNPALTGLDAKRASFIYRQQWVDVEGAPETQILSYEGPLKGKKVGLGLLISNDLVNVLGRSSFQGYYRYSSRLNEHSSLNFGLSLGYFQSRLLLNKLVSPDPVEIALINSVQNQGNMNGQIGLAYRHKSFELGLSRYQLLGNTIEIQNRVLAEQYNLEYRPHYRLRSSIALNMTDKLVLQPIFMATGHEISQIRTEIVANVIYDDKANLGMAYRDDFGMYFFAGMRLHGMIDLGYSYSRSLGSITQLSTNSHEVRMALLLDRFEQKDTDGDGVLDDKDEEKNTPPGVAVDGKGKALDLDKDGVADYQDHEPQTPANCSVDRFGVALDEDRDGVPNCVDMELGTPIGAEVDSLGRAKDSDSDGVIDLHDKEILTPHYVHINADSTPDASQCIVDHEGRACDRNGNGILDCKEVQGLDSGIKTSVERMINFSKEYDYYVVIGVFAIESNVKAYTKRLKSRFGVNSWTVKTNNNMNYVLYQKVYSQDQAREAIAELSDPELNEYITGNPWVWQTRK